MNTTLFRNPRFHVIVWSFFLSLSIYFFVNQSTHEGSLQIIKLTQYYALTSVIYLYITLLTTPITRIFLSFPFRAKYLVAKRALGFSSWYFALLHASFAFFGQLGGFGGLPFLEGTYLFAIILGFTALSILSLLACTSFDSIVTRLTFRRWKFLHRFVYLAGIFILIHALLLGTHFTSFGNPLAEIGFLMIVLLFLLEAMRIDVYIKQRFSLVPQIGSVTTIFLCVLFSFVTYSLSSSPISPFGIHAQHLQKAQEETTPLGMNSDKKFRYSASFHKPDVIKPQKDVTFTIQVHDAENGKIATTITSFNEKQMHSFIVDNTLTYFQPLYPTFKNDTFSITTQLPKDGLYRMYLIFQPLGAVEQQFEFTLYVGEKHASSLSLPASNVVTSDK